MSGEKGKEEGQRTVEEDAAERERMVATKRSTVELFKQNKIVAKARLEAARVKAEAARERLQALLIEQREALELLDPLREIGRKLDVCEREVLEAKADVEREEGEEEREGLISEIRRRKKAIAAEEKEIATCWERMEALVYEELLRGTSRDPLVETVPAVMRLIERRLEIEEEVEAETAAAAEADVARRGKGDAIQVPAAT